MDMKIFLTGTRILKVIVKSDSEINFRTSRKFDIIILQKVSPRDDYTMFFGDLSMETVIFLRYNGGDIIQGERRI